MIEVLRVVQRKGNMMRKLVALLMIFSWVVFSGSSYSAITQQRLPNETFQHAKNRVKDDLSQYNSNVLLIKDTPLRKKVPVNEINFSRVPELDSYQELIYMFHLIRDSRYLYLKDNPQFARRISWLYPDDGCFARAALSSMKLNETQIIRPVKIFAFGELVVQTPYAPSGAVSWWYHVAVVIRYMGVIYVLDPAINNQVPILVEDWFNTMGSVANLKGVVCNSYAYDPFDDCFRATDKSDQRARNDQLIYLHKEWNRMGRLGFDPVIILGDNPPWIPEYLNK